MLMAMADFWLALFLFYVSIYFHFHFCEHIILFYIDMYDVIYEADDAFSYIK